MDRKRLTILSLVVLFLLAITSAVIIFIFAFKFFEIEGYEGSELSSLIQVETSDNPDVQAVDNSAVAIGTPVTVTGSVDQDKPGISLSDTILHTVQFEENLFQMRALTSWAGSMMDRTTWVNSRICKPSSIIMPDLMCDRGKGFT